MQPEAKPPRMPKPTDHHAVWPDRVPHAITVPRTPLHDAVAVNARRYPDKPALAYFGQTWSYQRLWHEAQRVAAYLAHIGVKRGDRVLLLMQNCPQLVVAHLGILRAQAVVVPCNPMNRALELQHMLRDPDAVVAITSADLAGELVAASSALEPHEQLQHLIVTQMAEGIDPALATGPHTVPPQWQDWLLKIRDLPALPGGTVHTWASVLANPHAPPPDEVGADDLAILPYTSGTTGLPKGCMHTHASISHNAVAGTLWGGGSHENRTLCVVPMFHITGMVSVMHTTLYAGALLVVMPRWDRETAAQWIAAWRVTHWTNIPTMVIDLLGSPNVANFDLSSLLYIGGGGAAMPQAVAQRLLETYGLRYVEGYGLTETAAPSHSNPMHAPKQQCLGIPYLSTDARVIDPVTLQEMPVGESGEIIMRGPEVFQGYWKRPEATAQAFVTHDGHRFFRSGDLGRRDEQGYFFMTDRLKRMINASGFKVWPAEVEAMMFAHPAIQEACVIGTQDAYRGESVKAVVVLRASHVGQVQPQDIIDWCRQQMAAYKVPRVVQITDSLPKSGSGKVMWRLLQEKEQAGQ